MDKKRTESEIQRERLVSFIIQAINHLGTRELDLIARFIKAISE